METEHDFLISKTFIFESQNSFHSQNLEILLKQDLEQINIGQVIDIFRQKNALHDPLAFKIFDTSLNQFFPLDPSKHIPRSFGYSPVIMIKYKTIDKNAEKGSLLGSVSANKRQRNRERTIREVLQYVKKWRDTHNTLDRQKNKVNLQDSAKKVGISKKSLDDYFCQLRLAQQYGFDFHNNMEQKVGVLRSFVKKSRPKGQVNAKHQRLPKKLKIIEELGELLQTKDIEQKNVIKIEDTQIVSSSEQSKTLLPPIQQQQEDNRFYNSLAFPPDDLDEIGFERQIRINKCQQEFNQCHFKHQS